MELVALFYLIDEFCKEFEPKWHAQRIASGERQRIKHCQMSLSEILTIIIHFHQSNHKTLSTSPNPKHLVSSHLCTIRA